MCVLENVSDKNVPPDLASCMLYIDNALSVRALQEMMSSEHEMVIKLNSLSKYALEKYNR